MNCVCPVRIALIVFFLFLDTKGSRFPNLSQAIVIQKVDELFLLGYIFYFQYLQMSHDQYAQYNHPSFSITFNRCANKIE